MYFCQFKSRFLCIMWKYLLLLTSGVTSQVKIVLLYTTGKPVLTQGIPLHWTYCQLTEMVNYWYGYRGKKESKVRKHLRKSPFFPLPQAQLQPRHLSPSSSSPLPLFASWVRGQAPRWGNRQCRRLGSAPGGFFLLLLPSYSLVLPFLLVLSALAWLPLRAAVLQGVPVPV